MTGWETRTGDDARRLMAALPDADARALVEYLARHPGQAHDSEAIQTALGFAQHRQVALAASTVGEAAAAIGLTRPWTEGQRGYAMPEQTAALFR